MSKLRNVSILLSLFVAPAIAAAITSHPLADIKETAIKHVRANFASKESDIRISAKNLDPRLKLSLCEHDLQAHMPYANLRSTNTIVAVSCEGTQPWSLYVPVNIQIYREVAVASRPLPQGLILKTDDIEMQRMDVSQITGGYLADPNNAVGQLLTRPLQLGRPIMTSLLKAPLVVRRGQTITMLAKQSSFEVRSMGESLMDGAVGERIKVRNRRSKRIVEGVVAKNGLVFIN